MVRGWFTGETIVKGVRLKGCSFNMGVIDVFGLLRGW